MAADKKKAQQRYLVAAGLADALLAAPQAAAAMHESATMALGQGYRWLRPLIKRIQAHFPSGFGKVTRRQLIKFLLADPGFEHASTGKAPPSIRHYPLASPAPTPPPEWLGGALLPALPDLASVAHWLGITPSELEWFADWRGMNRAPGALSHYHCRWMAKKSGSVRLIEQPKPRLRAMQKQILHDILNHIPPHPAAHGFRRGHSCKSFVAGHIGQRVVMRFDLDNFFGSIPAPRVAAMFRSIGYIERVAKALAGFCTARAPSAVLAASPLTWHERNRLHTPHLPQGAPTSPALANLCTFGLDCRLNALAKSVGGHYSRYADDLAFSGGESVRRAVKALVPRIGAIVAEEGLRLNFKKTKIMHQSDRQTLTGIVINAKTNVRREEYDSLKAILHNCRHDGTAAQNIAGHPDFRAHLLGRIQHIASLNIARGIKLMQLYHQLHWPEDEQAASRGIGDET